MEDLGAVIVVGFVKDEELVMESIVYSDHV